MQPGDRQEMRQAGFAKGLLDLLGHRAALAGDQCRGDAAGRAGQHRGDAPRHLGAQAQQPLAPAAAGIGAFRAVDPAGRAEAVADPADPGEIELALQVAAARHDLRRHRVEERLQRDLGRRACSGSLVGGMCRRRRRG